MLNLTLSPDSNKLAVQYNESAKLPTPFEGVKSAGSKKSIFEILATPFRALKNQISHIAKDKDRTSIMHVKLVGEDGKVIEERRTIVKTESIREYLKLGSKDWSVKEIVPLFGNSRFDLEIRGRNVTDSDEFFRILKEEQDLEIVAKVDPETIARFKDSLGKKSDSELDRLRSGIQGNLKSNEGNSDKQKAFLVLIENEMKTRSK